MNPTVAKTEQKAEKRKKTADLHAISPDCLERSSIALPI
jgi:hypothetical protein